MTHYFPKKEMQRSVSDVTEPVQCERTSKEGFKALTYSLGSFSDAALDK